MPERLDIILFGASGFTGKHAIPYLHKFANEGERKLTWGIAGRTEGKLKDALIEMQTRTGTDFGNVPIIIADIKDEASLKQMALRARCIINCCGPYRFYGEQVVKTCIENGTHHVDVSGEPQYMESMQLKYNDLAKEKNVYIVSACGFDSIPCDFGTTFLKSKFEGTLNSVETYLSIKEIGEKIPGPVLNTGTWESAVYGLAFANELRGLRRQLFPTRLPTFKPKLEKRGILHKDESGSWTIPFMGSDRSVAMRSQYYFHEVENERPIQIQTYMKVGSLFNVFFLGLFGIFFLLFSKFSYGQKLLLRYPAFFSGGFCTGEGPSEEKQENSIFSLTLYGKGWSKKFENTNQDINEPMDKEVVVRVQGKNPGYGSTNVMLTMSAITLLTEMENLPKGGGVFSPGALFAKTSLAEKLNQNGVKFEVIRNKTY